MKRILHISKYYYPFIGGVEQIARDTVKALKGEAEQKVICFDHNPHSKDSVDQVDGIEVIRVGQQLLLASQAIGLTYGRQLKETIDRFNPDIIIFHYPNPFVSHYLLKYITKTNIKLFVYWHLDIYKQKLLKYLFYSQNDKLLSRADTVIATSPNYIDGSPWLSKYKSKCKVIPNCINEERLNISSESEEMSKRIRDENDGKIICLAIGRHVPYKGLEYLIRASKKLDSRFAIRITGKGPLTNQLKKLAEGDEKIKFLGQVDNTELIANLMACDIYTFPSITKNEAFGVALAEGMYFRHPAVTFTIPGSGVNYVNLDGVTGIECPNKDVDAFANAITYLADHKNVAKKYANAARNRVESNFLFKQYKENIKKLIV
jgi:glycosyltransferase involved in cell wall biosynthesis